MRRRPPHHTHHIAPTSLARYRQVPVAAVLPGQSRRGSRRVVEEHAPRPRFQSVARGSGTSLLASALPIAEGVLIMLARLRRYCRYRSRTTAWWFGRASANLATLARDRAPPTSLHRPFPAGSSARSAEIAGNSGSAHCFGYRLGNPASPGSRWLLEAAPRSSSSSATPPDTTCSARSSGSKDTLGDGHEEDHPAHDPHTSELMSTLIAFFWRRGGRQGRL